LDPPTCNIHRRVEPILLKDEEPGLRRFSPSALEGPSDRGAATWNVTCFAKYDSRAMKGNRLWKKSRRNVEFHKGHSVAELLAGQQLLV
jgi:hypothetical protein